MEHIPVKDVRQSITIEMGRHGEKGALQDSISLYEWGNCECGKRSTRLLVIMTMPFSSVMAPVNSDTMAGDTYALIREFKNGFLSAIRRNDVNVTLFGRLAGYLGTSQED